MKSFFFISPAAVAETEEEKCILFFILEQSLLSSTRSLLVWWNCIHHLRSHKTISQRDAFSEDHVNAVRARIMQLFTLHSSKFSVTVCKIYSIWVMLTHMLLICD